MKQRTPKLDLEARLVDAAFKRLAEESWQNLTLASVARAAKIPLPQLYTVAPSKSALVGIMLRRISDETARRYRPDRTSYTARDRTFDVSMTWFEVAWSRRIAMKHLFDGLRHDLPSLFTARREIVAAAEWILVLAEADMGSAVPIRAVILAGVCARTMPTWLADDEEMGKTMAEFDRGLDRVERFLWPRSAPKKNASEGPGKRKAR